ncbi:CDC45-like protein [Rhizodiscina lignyota]|uniref:CDC45-like protein n=1 Tax=Rhizodiscina lignyota TaxID=1504668 RepID=A0A9P4ICB2_9PEZI|nr:CDC45-like protein [Rhizodiscina lignyota]
MFLPRELLSHLYLHLLRTSHALSPPVLILVALEPDALCASQILTALLKRDFIPHKIQPVSGIQDLLRAGRELVQPMRTTDGGSGGVVVCLGLGALYDLEETLFLEEVAVGRDDDGYDIREPRFNGYGGVECWVVDARRPWHLDNMFSNFERAEEVDETAVARVPGVKDGKVTQAYKPGRGGIICFDDGDIEEDLKAERDAYHGALEARRALEDGGDENEGDADDEDVEDRIPDSAQDTSRKRKSLSDAEDESEDESDRPAQRRRSNSVSDGLGASSDESRSPTPGSRSSSLPRRRSKKEESLEEKIWKKWASDELVLDRYNNLGSSFAEPISSMMYSLASDLGKEDNDLLWQCIVGVSSMELAGQTHAGLGLSPLSTAGGSSGWNGVRGERIRSVLREEVRRLNPLPVTDIYGLDPNNGIIQTHARSPTDTAIRLSPEPRFLLIRHWSLYDSMLHSPYLSAKLHIWSDNGRRRLHKLLAKMGVSLAQCRQSYTHMDMDLKRSLREKLLKFAPQYGLEGLVPPVGRGGREAKEGWGFVRCWGWKACLSAVDVGVVVGSILDVGVAENKNGASGAGMRAQDNSQLTYSQRVQGVVNVDQDIIAALDRERADDANARFWTAYDALSSASQLAGHIATAQYLHRAILRTGTSLIEKKQIRHLKAFRMAVVKEGPDVQLFTHAGALIKLALWVAEAVIEMEGGRSSSVKKGSELVMAALDEARGSYIVRKKKREEAKETKKKEREKEKEMRREQRLANGDSDYESDEENEEDEEDSDDSDDESDVDEEEEKRKKDRGYGRNRFGKAFKDVMDDMGLAVRIDSFEHCVAQVRKEELSSFLEELSMRAVVG